VPGNLTAPTLSGSAVVGRTLTESHGTWTGNPTSYRYQWLRCPAASACVPIVGATGQTYTITGADAGATLEVSESATNANGTSPSATSRPTARVVPPVPGAASPPAISGTAQVGSVLVEVGAKWTENPTAFGFQWWRCRGGVCAVIPGATADTYTLVAADLGATIKVSETATNAGGTSAPATSAAVGPVAAASTPPPGKVPSAAQIRTALKPVVATPARAKTGPRALTTFTLSFSAPCAGHLTVTWSVKVGRKRVAIATLRVTVSRSGKLRLRLVLSARGKQLVKRSRRLSVQAAAAFAPTGHAGVSLSRAFSLHR
jgi:hypothetical protein